MDLKVMLRFYKGHKSILVVIDEVTNFMVMIPIYQSRSEEIGDALIECLCGKYSMCECMIMDQNNAFINTLIGYLFKKLGIKIKTFANYDNKSIQEEHGIKPLATIFIKHLTGLGKLRAEPYHLHCIVIILFGVQI